MLIKIIRTNKRYIIHQCETIESSWNIKLRCSVIINLDEIIFEERNKLGTILKIEDCYSKYEFEYQVVEGKLPPLTEDECNEMLALLDDSYTVGCYYFAYIANRELFEEFESY